MTDSCSLSNAYAATRNDHHWPFVGELRAPIVTISQAQFVGPGKTYPDDARQVSHTAPTLNFIDGDPEPLGYEDYQVVKAWRHHVAHKRHSRHPLAPHVDGGLVLLTAEGEPIGRTLFNHVHLEATPHRSMRLGAELIAAFEVAFPEVLIAYAFRAPRRTYTKQGKATIELAYGLLSTRGAVIDPKALAELQKAAAAAEESA